MPNELRPLRGKRNPRIKQRRLDMFENGWPPVQCEGKSRMDMGWTKDVITRELIEAWDERGSKYKNLIGTGVRLEGDIFVIDIDVSMPGVYDRIVERLFARWPDFFAENGALERTSGSTKSAFFGRISRPFKAARTHRYTAERALLEQLSDPTLDNTQRKAIRKTLNGQLVETYGGLATRYFAWDGPHSTKGRFYGPVEPDRAPWNVRLDSLPVFNHDELGELIDMCDAVLGEMLERVPDSGQQPAGVFFDLTPDMTFISQDGHEETLESLAGRLQPGAENGVRGCMDWLAWSMSDSKANCNAFIGAHGRLIIQSFQDDQQHRMVFDGPPEPMQLDEDTLAAIRAIPEPQAPTGGAPPEPPPQSPDEAEPAPDATPDDVLQFLIRNYAVDRHAGAIVDMRATDIDRAHLDVPTFHLIYGAFRFFTAPRTERGQGQWTPVTKVFLIHPQHLTVTGTRFRPDRAFPRYVEDGQTYKNVWRKPVHAGACDLSWLFRHFFPIFIPDAVERDYYLDVVAHRWVYPAIPGPSVVMVAHGAANALRSDYGTGRSGWFDFQARLYGRHYVRNEDFSVVVGQNRQGDFTSWKAFRRLVTIDEAQTTSEQTTIKGAHATYEILKTMVDPSPRWRTFKVKYGKPFEEFDYAPMDIASNHQGAVSIPTGDRRFAVINNGRALTEDEADRLYALINMPGAAAVFARWCESRDLSRFKPFAPPPQFEPKARMQALAETELDVVFRDMQKRFGRLFTKSQARMFATNNLETRPQHGDSQFEKRFDAAFRHYCTALRDGEIDIRIVVEVIDEKTRETLKELGQEPGAKRERVHTFEARNVAQLMGWVPDAIRREVAKSGKAATQKHMFEVHNGGIGPDGGPRGQSVGHD